MMAVMLVRCPHGHTTDVMKHGVTAQGKPRYRGQPANGPRHTFIIDYRDQGRLPAITQQIIDMARNGRGIRDIARVLKMSQTTVLETFKKRHLTSSMAIMRSCMTGIQQTCASSSTQWQPQKLMKGGVWSATKLSNAGDGMPSITEAG
jgi:transposase-like protein